MNKNGVRFLMAAVPCFLAGCGGNGQVDSNPASYGQEAETCVWTPSGFENSHLYKRLITDYPGIYVNNNGDLCTDEGIICAKTPNGISEQDLQGVVESEGFGIVVSDSEYYCMQKN